ncbi:MAG: hypothetical protein JWP00_1878 [Chloroflexi bacterium]|jgi:hypothetical protein|nr:hypothetical protein [Chloroflexota bacterium]
MRNYSSGGSGLTSLILKGVVLLVALFILAAVAKTVIAVAVSVMTLVAIGIGIWLLLKFLGTNRTRY